MKTKLLCLLISFILMDLDAEDRLTWLRDRPIKKQLVVSTSSPTKSKTKTAWTISSKDTRQRTVRVSNQRSTVYKAKTLSPQQLNLYIAKMEDELMKLNKPEILEKNTTQNQSEKTAPKESKQERSNQLQQLLKDIETNHNTNH